MAIVRESWGNSSAIDTGSSTTPTLTKPSGVADGDLLLAVFAVKAGVTVDAVPTGWTAFIPGGTVQNPAVNYTLAAYYKVASSEGAGPYTWTVSSSAAWRGAIMRYSGVDTSTPVDVTANEYSGASASAHTVPQLTGTTAGCMLVAACGNQSTGYTISLTGEPVTELWESVDGNITNFADGLDADGGNTGSVTFDFTTSTAAAGFLGALRPGGGDTTPEDTDSASAAEAGTVTATASGTDSGTFADATYTLEPGTASDSATFAEAGVLVPSFVAADSATFSESAALESNGQVVMRPNGTGTLANVNNQAGSTTNIHLDVDDDPDSPDTADYVKNATDTSGDKTAFFLLDDTPLDFAGMSTLTIDAHIATANFSNDTCTLFARLYKSDETTTLSDEVQVATQVSSGLQSVAFTGLSLGNKTDWDGARLRLRWAYTRSAGADGGQLRVTAFELEGSYVYAASLAGSDSGTFAELSTLTVVATGTDTAAVADSGVVGTSFTGSDSGAVAETYLLESVGSDSATASESASYTVAVSGTDSASLTETPSINVPGVGTLGVPLFRHGRWTRLSITNPDGDTVLLSSGMRNMTFSRSVETQDITQFGPGVAEHVPLVRGGTMAVDGLFSSTHAKTLEDCLKSSTALTVTTSFGLDNSTFDRRTYSGACRLTGLDITAAFNDVVSVSFDLGLTSDVTFST